MSNIKTGTTYTAGQQTQKIVGAGLYLFPIMYKYYKNLLYMFFDYNNQTNRSLKQKFLPMEATLTQDGKSLEWYDYSMFDIETTVVSADATAVELTMASTAGYETGDWILIIKASGAASVRKKITVTLDTKIAWTGATALVAGDKIIRLYYVQPDFTLITRGQSGYSYIEFKSYFQTFARTVTFNKTDLNKNYLIEADAKQYIVDIFSYNMSILLQEFNKAIWMGGNIGGTAENEMLGIDTAITSIVAGTNGMTADASLLVDFSGAADDDAKITLFMNAIESASASGAIPSTETLIVPCNQKFLSALARLKSKDIIYNEKIDVIDFKIFKFQNMFGQVEFFHEPMLDRLSAVSLAYILPRSLMSLRFRKNQILEDEKGAISSAVTEISVQKQITNIRDKAIFDMSFEAGMILGGLTSGAYRKLIKLA